MKLKLTLLLSLCALALTGHENVAVNAQLQRCVENRWPHNDGHCRVDFTIEHEVIGNVTDTADLLNGK